MEENKLKFFKYCTLLLIDDDNHSKYLFLKKNEFHIEYGDNRSIYVNILNTFKDIRKSYEIDVEDITDNYYKYDIPGIKKYCTILLIDDMHTGRMYISEKNMCYIRYDDNDDKLVYHKILNDLEFFALVKNNIVKLINNGKLKHNITLLVDDFRIFIFEKRW